MTEREEFEKWWAAHRCEGYPNCDGELEGEPHEPGCPLFGRTDSTLFDAWQAGRSRLTSGLRELAEKWRKEADGISYHEPSGPRQLMASTYYACWEELLALIPEATQKVSDKKSASK